MSWLGKRAKPSASRSWTTWLVAAATSLLLALPALAQDELEITGGAIAAGETFTPPVDIVWRTEAAFRHLLEDALQKAPLERALEARIEENAKLKEALAERERQVQALGQAIAALERERDAYSSLADTVEAAFDRTNDLLVKEQSKNGPLFVWGPQAGVGYLWNGDTGDFGAYVGVGVTYNISGRR